MFRRSLLGLLRLSLLTSFFLIGGCSPSSTLPTAEPTLTPVNTESAPTATATSVEGEDKQTYPLFVNPDNGRYFTDGVKIDGRYRSVYLAGAHTWCDFMDCGSTNPPPAFDYNKFLDFLQANNLNFFRLWRAENARGGEADPDFWFDPMPYERSSECCAFDGGNKFDLETFNQAFFDRMRERVVKAADRGIYVSIMLFDGWSVESKSGSHDPWAGHPYKLENNINNVNGDVNGNGQGEDTHILTNTPVTDLQEAYIRKVVDSVNDLDNVLYEISNESAGNSQDWQFHLIRFIKDYEATMPKQHPVGMTVEYPGGDNADLFASQADWISPNGNLDDRPVADGSKVILADTDHLCGLCGNLQFVWRSFSRGENPLFMDPYDGSFTGRGAPNDYDPNNANDVSLLLNIGYTRKYANRMNLTMMTPLPELCSTTYCLANPISEGAEYLIYVPSGVQAGNILNELGINRRPRIYLPEDGKIAVDLTGSPVELKVEWFDAGDGTYQDGGTIQGGSVQTFTSPVWGDAVLYIYDSRNP